MTVDNVGGRPKIIDENVVNILESAFMDGSTVTEACYIAKITRTTFYNYMVEGTEFFDRMTRALSYIDNIAKLNLAQAIKRKDLETSKWWAERKIKEEFSLRNEVTGANGKDLIPQVLNELESNYDELGSKAEGQMVADESSLQD